MEYLVWVGPRDSDIQFSKCFKESICYFSEKNPNSDRKAHIYGNSYIEFIKNKMENLLEFHPEARFIFYNPKIAYGLNENLRKYILCLNKKFILDLLSDKIYTRYWMGNYVPVLPSLLVDSHHLSFSELDEKLGYSKNYVIQQNRSSGGFGTFYVEKKEQALNIFRERYNELFIISPYVENGLSVNINAIVCNNQIYLFPISLQIIENNNNRLIYHGADYIAAQNINAEIQTKIKKYSKVILEHVQSLGYRGIIGIDFIVKDGNVYFQEINPRYQASSFLIDASLTENGYPVLTEINLSSFYEQCDISMDVQNITVEYSFYKYLYTSGAKHLYHIEQIAHNNPYISHVLLDGWDNSMTVEVDSYCYTLVFSTNITSLNFDGGYNLYSNITGEEEYLKEYISSRIGLKIALLNQGCVITAEAMSYLNSKGIIKKALFSSIDFQLSDGLSINAPVNLKFTDLSPFNITVSVNKHLKLNYYNECISEIYLEMQPNWSNLKTQNKVPYSRIAYLSTDRLRVKHETICSLKKKGLGCSFCSIPLSKTTFNMDDIKEVINNLLDKPKFRHILIGGGSGNPDTEYKQIIEISKSIRAVNSNIPIYLMSLPPLKADILMQYKSAGITEIAFNIEIWNRSLAKELMPGKGLIPLELYLRALKEGTKIWGTTGNVRTALIVGLDNMDTLLEGVEYLSKQGIQPMISIFRPMVNTKLEALVPPSNKVLLSFYEKAQDICKQHNLKLGPTCDACKNNMLAI